MDYTNLPKITVVKIEDLPNGDAKVTFDYDDLFVKFAQKELKLDCIPTEEQLSQFILDIIMKSVEKQDGWNLEKQLSDLDKFEEESKKSKLMVSAKKNPELKDIL